MRGVRVNVLQSEGSLVKVQQSLLMSSSQKSLMKTPGTKKSQILRKPELGNRKDSNLEIALGGLAPDDRPISPTTNHPVESKSSTLESSQSPPSLRIARMSILRKLVILISKL